MNKSLIVLIVIIISSTIMYFISGIPQPTILTCTKDVFICRDGSRVRRVEPECKFAACPKVIKTEPTATPSATITPDYKCPETEWVNCMPPIGIKKSDCRSEFLQWAKDNCPDFKGAAY
jgi:hypothetical protein